MVGVVTLDCLPDVVFGRGVSEGYARFAVEIVF